VRIKRIQIDSAGNLVGALRNLNTSVSQVEDAGGIEAIGNRCDQPARQRIAADLMEIAETFREWIASVKNKE
jgi:hypothetical protein